jgi:hypothetical protein
MTVAAASNPLLNTAGRSLSAVSFSAASLSVSFPSRNKGVTNAIDSGRGATTLDGTGIESVSCLFSIVNIWRSNCN